MSKKLNLIGNQFGKLTVIKYAGTKNNRTAWLCKCECGNYTTVIGKNLKNGNTKSCGCLHVENARKLFTKHGKSHTRVYHIYSNILKRCTNTSNKDYKYYGGRGIAVCDEWKDNFQAFYDWSMSNGYKDNLTIDRINNDGNYEPSNCRWTTMKQQARNKRNITRKEVL